MEAKTIGNFEIIVILTLPLKDLNGSFLYCGEIYIKYFFFLPNCSARNSVGCWVGMVQAGTFLVFLILLRAALGLLSSSVSAVGLSQTGVMMFRRAHSVPNWLWVFIMKGWWILSNAFIASLGIIILFLSFILLLWDSIIDSLLICICWLFLHPRNKSHLVRVYNPFHVLLNLVC